MENFRQLMEIVGTAVDAVGVFIVAAGALVATARLLIHRAHNIGNYYSSYRQDIGRAILLGLEFLIAGDIIRTVVVAPTIQNVLVLGLIVLIRTFLSLSLQLEIEGRLPWRREGLPQININVADAVFTETALFCCLISCLNHVDRKFLSDRAIELPLCRGAANTASFNEISKKEAV
jgi:uncharacterized membrane protein